MRRCWMLTLLMCTVVVGLPTQAVAQAPEQPEANERESLVAVLERRVEAYENNIERLRDTIAAIRSGAPIEGIRERMREDRAGGEPRREGRPDEGDRPRAGDGEEPGERRRGNRGAERATPEQIERVLGMIEHHRPEIAAQLRTLRDENPERFEHAVTRIVSFIARDPESAMMMIDLRTADARVEELKRELKSAPERETELRDAIEEAVRTAAEARLAFESRMIEREREQLDEREARLAAFRDDFDALVEQRVDAIVNGREPTGGQRAPEDGPEARDQRGRGRGGGPPASRD